MHKIAKYVSLKMPMFHILLNVTYDHKKSASGKMDTADTYELFWKIIELFKNFNMPLSMHGL